LLKMSTQGLDTLLKQLEFYFSDSNLWKSKFLQEQISLDPEKQGFVDISTIATFNKVKGFTIDEIKEAVKKSQKLALNSDGTKIKRRIPLPKENKTEIERRTIYVEGLPEDVTIDSLKEFMEQFGGGGGGGVTYVTIPPLRESNQSQEKSQLTTTNENSTDRKIFAFVEFCSSEDASKAVTNLQNTLFNNKKLIAISKKEWILKKSSGAALKSNDKKKL